MPHNKPERGYTPTPEEITEECRRIREGWSEDKWAQQSRVVPWSLPEKVHPFPDKDIMK